MIVDCHTHLWKAEHGAEEIAKEAWITTKSESKLDIGEEEHWEAMRPVDRAIIFGLRSRYFGISVPNDVVASYAAAHPEKLIGFACLDPWEPGYLDEMRRAFEDLKLRGLKLVPINQDYHPMDGRMQPVYSYCETHGIPLMVHQGTTFARRAPLKYALPVLMEDVALAYPDLKIVIAHMGHPWIDDTVLLIRKQPNVYADVSALYCRPWQFCNGLLAAVECGCFDKLLLGSDYPFTQPGDTLRRLRQVNGVTGDSRLPRIPEEAIEALIERDTLNLLGLE
jgi:uncharacterized protein